MIDEYAPPPEFEEYDPTTLELVGAPTPDFWLPGDELAEDERAAIEPRATTPLGLPYPAPTDPVSQGAANIQALANATDARLKPEYIYQEQASNIPVATGATRFLDLFAAAPFPAGQYLDLQFWVAGYNTGQTAQYLRFLFYMNEFISIGVVDVPLTNSAFIFAPVHVRLRKLPVSAGTGRFTIDAQCSAGTATLIGSGGYPPMWMRVTRW